MKKFMKWAIFFIFLTSLGCATQFYGSAHTIGGPKGCRSKCAELGMEFVGMVTMGEYSDGCICRVKGAQISQADIGGITASVVGVIMQMRRAAKERTRQTQQRKMVSPSRYSLEP
jgi:hypothetical protein